MISQVSTPAPTNAPPPRSVSYPGYSRSPYYPQSLYYPDFLYSRNVYLDNVMNGYNPGYTYTWANGGNGGNGWNGNGERVNKNINNISVNVPSSGQTQNK